MSGPLPEFLGPITRPASRLYGRIIARRNAQFDRGRGITKIDRPVISVGNITTGGTGKTPMVMWIANWLLSQVREPAIVMRGYMADVGHPSDEEAEYLRLLPNVAVLAQPKRKAALQSFLPQHPEVDCVLLDDGFQHRQLHRDLDLVLIDATRSTFNDRLLPAGHLREPLSQLSRASAIIVTRSEDMDGAIVKQIVSFHGKPPIAWTRHHWTQLWVEDVCGAAEPQPVTWLKDKRILTMLGIGHPQPLLSQLEKAGAKVAVNIPARDHERFNHGKLAVARGLCDGLDAMVVTMKDWLRMSLAGRPQWPIPIVIPQLEMEVWEGEKALKSILLDAVPSRRHLSKPL